VTIQRRAFLAAGIAAAAATAQDPNAVVIDPAPRLGIHEAVAATDSRCAVMRGGACGRTVERSRAGGKTCPSARKWALRPLSQCFVERRLWDSLSVGRTLSPKKINNLGFLSRGRETTLNVQQMSAGRATAGSSLCLPPGLIPAVRTLWRRIR
jgi:hypothetical protein